MALLLTGAVLGAFGGGPLAHAAAGGEWAALRLEYDRFVRYQATTSLRVRVEPQAAEDGKVHLWLDREWLEGVSVEGIMPEPAAMEIGEDRLVYEFDLAGEGDAVEVELRVRPEKPWARRGSVGIAGRAPVRFRQFVYP